MFFILTVLAGLGGLPGAALGQDAAARCDELAGNPDDPRRTGGGVVFKDLDVARAEAACRAAVKAQPGQPRLVYQLGRVLHIKQDFESARRCYEEAAARGYVVALNGLGLLYEAGEGVKQDHKRAGDYYRQAHEAGVIAATTNLGVLYLDGLGVQQNLEEAVRLFQLGAGAGHALAHLELGWLRSVGRGVAKDEAEAERLFRLAIDSRDPEAAAEAKSGLAWMWALGGRNLPEAERLAIAATEHDPESDGYIDTLALVRHRQGRNEEAARDMQKAIALADDYAPYYDRLGDIYAALGRADDARTQWKKALALPDPTSFDPEWDRAAVERKLKQAR